MSELGARHVWEMPLESDVGAGYVWLTREKAERPDMSSLGDLVTLVLALGLNCGLRQ
jgi:hypothetical protein